MRKFLPVVALLAILVACGEDSKPEEKVLELKNFKEKLSYTLGADHARAISDSGDKNFDKYDLDEIVKGFQAGVENENAFGEDCKNTLKNLFGPSGASFDAKYAKEGSNCIGKISGVLFSGGWKRKNAFDKIDMKLVLIGFEHGLKKIDTLVERSEQASMIQNFMADLNKQNGMKMLDDAKLKKNVKVTASGIVLETLLEGKGGSPAPGDDVLAQYILMNSLGDTLQDSKKMSEELNQPLSAFSLNQVVPGWQEGMPMMKKGGKYMLYIPFHLAWGDQGMFNPNTNSYEIQPFESVVFYVELLNYGKPGSLTK